MIPSINQTVNIRTQHPHSPSHLNSVNQFKKTSFRKGHSLMRRTELSWNKLRNKSQSQQKNTKYLKGSKEYDYYGGGLRKGQNQLVRQKLKGVGSETPKRNQQNTKLFKREFGKFRFQEKTKCKQDLGKRVQQYCLRPKNKKQNEKRPEKEGEKRKVRKIHKGKHFPKEKKRQQKESVNLVQKIASQTQKSSKNLKFSLEFQCEEYGLKLRKKQNKMAMSKEQFSTIESIHNQILPLSSKSSVIDPIEHIHSKVNLHLTILKELAQYSTEILQTYEQTGEWEELVFLVYKKYYLQRLKVSRSLRGISSSPFIINVCRITDEELQKYLKCMTGIKMVKEVESGNKTIMDSLRNFYNLIIEKSGNHINLEERNDFRKQIFKEMEVEINLLKQINSPESRDRLRKVYRCAFLIAELEGNPLLTYEQSLQNDVDKYLAKAETRYPYCLIL